MEETMLSAVRRDLGITSTKKDKDIEVAIAAAVRRLSMVGVELVSTSDDLTMQAVKLYCRAWFNFQGDGERYQQAFEHLANGMSHAREYRG